MNSLDKTTRDYFSRYHMLFRKGLLSKEKIDYLDKKFPEWRKEKLHDHRWLEKAEALKEREQELGYLPSSSDINGGVWLSHQRIAAKGKNSMLWTSERQEYMDTHFPGWQDTRLYTWIKKAEALKKREQELGHLPGATDGLEGLWLKTQRDTATSSNRFWSSERQEYMDTHFPGWQDTISNKSKWLAKAEALKKREQELGHLPAQNEGQEGWWLATQRQAAREAESGSWSSERQEYMDTHFPGWQNMVFYRWAIRAKALKKREQELGYLPPLSDGSEGRWLSKARQAANGSYKAHTWTSERQEYMDIHFPGWLD